MTGALDEIRRLELKVARDIEAARTAAADRITDAQRRARAMIEAAAEEGKAEADRSHRRRVEAAREEAERLRTEGAEAATRLVHDVEPELERAVDALTALVLSPPEERGV